mmetsp:Transcript_4625/g.7948  ORF Transcript_4625/g.7948 Transcript_4625/m.7948 type:complete len:98 (-) Transcript_4625:371-664(-)
MGTDSEGSENGPAITVNVRWTQKGTAVLQISMQLFYMYRCRLRDVSSRQSAVHILSGFFFQLSAGCTTQSKPVQCTDVGLPSHLRGVVRVLPLRHSL